MMLLIAMTVLLILILLIVAIGLVITRYFNVDIDMRIANFAKTHTLIYLNDDLPVNKKFIFTVRRVAKKYNFDLRLKTMLSFPFKFVDVQMYLKQRTDLEMESKSILFAVDISNNKIYYLSFSDLSFGIDPFAEKILGLFQLGDRDIAKLKLQVLRVIRDTADFYDFNKRQLGEMQ